MEENVSTAVQEKQVTVIVRKNTDELLDQALKIIDRHPELYINKGIKKRTVQTERSMRMNYASLLVIFYQKHNASFEKTLEQILALRTSCVGKRFVLSNYQAPPADTPGGVIRDINPLSESYREKNSYDFGDTVETWVSIDVVWDLRWRAGKQGGGRPIRYGAITVLHS